MVSEDANDDAQPPLGGGSGQVQPQLVGDEWASALTQNCTVPGTARITHVNLAYAHFAVMPGPYGIAAGSRALGSGLRHHQEGR